jgi:hypothetical protein
MIASAIGNLEAVEMLLNVGSNIQEKDWVSIIVD